MKELDIVILTKDIDGIRKGAQGTIVYNYGHSMFEVEFVSSAAVIMVHENDLKLVSPTFVEVPMAVLQEWVISLEMQEQSLNQKIFTKESIQKFINEKAR